jgi:[ribosomal protein S5]-alanine N-acetyltransferase
LKAIETERLLIRRFSMNDMTALHEILDVQMNWAGRPITVEQRTERMMVDVLGYPHDEYFGRRAVTHKESNTLMGYFGFRPELDYFDLPSEAPVTRLRSVEVEFHYALGRRFQGQGYGTEAFKALLDVAFNQARLDRLFASTEEANHASVALMRRVGMEPRPNPRPGWPDRLLARLTHQEYQRVQRT